MSYPRLSMLPLLHLFPPLTPLWIVRLPFRKNLLPLLCYPAGNQFCVANCRSTSAEEESEVREHVTGLRPRHPTSPCRIIVINTTEFDSPLHDAVEKLRSDGLTVEIDSWVTAQPDDPCLSSNSNDLIETVKTIAALMSVCGHALHQGDVYMKAPGATMAYVKMMDVGSYLYKLLANEYIRGSVLKHFTFLFKIWSHPACEMIVQIQFDLDLIEVSNGFFPNLASTIYSRRHSTGKMWSYFTSLVRATRLFNDAAVRILQTRRP